MDRVGQCLLPLGLVVAFAGCFGPGLDFGTCVQQKRPAFFGAGIPAYVWVVDRSDLRKAIKWYDETKNAIFSACSQAMGTGVGQTSFDHPDEIAVSRMKKIMRSGIFIVVSRETEEKKKWTCLYQMFSKRMAADWAEHFSEAFKRCSDTELVYFHKVGHEAKEVSTFANAGCGWSAPSTGFAFVKDGSVHWILWQYPMKFKGYWANAKRVLYVKVPLDPDQKATYKLPTRLP